MGSVRSRRRRLILPVVTAALTLAAVPPPGAPAPPHGRAAVNGGLRVSIAGRTDDAGLAAPATEAPRAPLAGAPDATA